MRLTLAALATVALLAAACGPDPRTSPQPVAVPTGGDANARRGLVARENPVVFGKAFDDETVTVKVGLRNTGSRAVRLRQAIGMCGCMRVGPVPEALAPGDEVEIGFTLKLAGIAGKLSKGVRISSDDATKPELRVRIEGEVSPRFVVTPRHAVVPVAATGQPRTVELVVRSGGGESLAGLTAVSSVAGVSVTTAVEGDSARLGVAVAPEVTRAQGTITLRLGKHEKVIALYDKSAGAGGLSVNEAGRLRRAREDDPDAAGAERSESLAVVFTGEDRGQIEPCGCTQGMLGGLSRRHARILAFLEPKVPFVAVSGGALVVGDEEYDRLRFQAITEALDAMGFAAIAPARREIALGKGARPPMVATDADEAPDRDLVQMLRLESGEALLYVVGIAGPGVAGAKAEGVPYVDPRNTLRTLREDLSEFVPIVILANVGEDAARELARFAGRPTLVLYASGVTDPGPEDVVEGPVAFAPFPAEGKYVGLARLRGRPGFGRWTVEYRPVEAELPEDETQLRLRKAHLERLRAADLVRSSAANPRFTPQALSGEPSPEGAVPDRFVGSASCAECHEEESRSWATSRHARAMESLRKTGDDVDPGCVACHVVGYGTGRGFLGTEETAHLADVGCEACHGPRGRHVDSDGKAGGTYPKGQTACAACHDGKHDPDFDFETRWPRIAHGRR